MGSLASDDSDFGTDPDPNANANAGDTGENDPTTFTMSTAQIGVAKSASVSNNEATFLFTLENLGNAAPTTLSLTDDLDAILGAGTYTVTQQPILTSTPRSLEVNPNYNGSADTNLIFSGSVDAGQTETISLKVRVDRLTDQGFGWGIYSNQASSNADGQIDLSDSGTNPDSDGDGIPNEGGENDGTTITFTQIPVIGLAHQASANGSLITLDYYLENFGNIDLLSVAISDDLDNTFGSGNYHIETAPAFIDNPGTLTLNSSFNGSTQTGLISSGTLAYADTAQIRVVVEIDIPSNTGSGFGIYSNQATASAAAPDNTVTQDDSDEGTDPDPNANGNPDEAGENDATTITQVINSLGVAHSVSVSGGEATLDFFLENLGNQTLTSLSLSSNLDTVFDAGTYTVTSPPTLVTAPQNLTLNTTFNGSSDIQLLDGGSMAPGVFEQIRVVVLVHELADQGSGFGVYSSQASAGADGPITDLSDQGTNPDPNGNARANDAGEDDPTTFTIAQNPVIGVSQTASVNGREVTFDCYLENLGNVSLSGVALPAPLNSLFGTSHFTIVTAPSLVDDPGTLTLNASYNGGTQPALISSGTLAVGETARIQFTAEVLLLNDSGSGYGVYSSQVTASGTGPDTTAHLRQRQTVAPIQTPTMITTQMKLTKTTQPSSPSVQGVSVTLLTTTSMATAALMAANRAWKACGFSSTSTKTVSKTGLIGAPPATATVPTCSPAFRWVRTISTSTRAVCRAALS